jgi:hypothetical protein
MKRAAVIILSVAILGLGACSSAKEPKGPFIEYYQPAFRQFPPEPVYSRLTWSHLSQPIKPKVRENAPLLMPTMAFELPRTTLGEAIEALAQSIGYYWSYPPESAGRPVAIKMTGSVDQILREIGRQADVYAVLDHKGRMVRVVTGEMINPAVPAAKLPGDKS